MGFVSRCFIFLLASLAATAQDVLPPTGTTVANPNVKAEHFTLTGSVIDSSTGAPVSRVLVTVRGPGSTEFAFTDASGHFTIENFTGSGTQFICQKPGYFDPSTPFIQVDSAQTAVTLKVSPYAFVKGQIVDETGEPVEGVTIQSFAALTILGVKRWLPDATAETDEDGFYELDSLAPGEHLLHTLMRRMAPSRIADAQHVQHVGPGRVYTPQYFPNAEGTSFSGFNLSPGQSVEANLTLKRQPGFRVSGTISAGTAQNVTVHLLDLQRDDVAAPIQVGSANGNFAFAPVAAGNWIISARGETETGAVMDEQTISVSAPLTMKLQLERGSDIPFQTTLGAERAFPGAISLVRDGAFGAEERFFPQPKDPADNSNALNFADLPVGHYRVEEISVSGKAEFGCLAGFHFGTADALRDGLSVPGHTTLPPLEAVFRNDCGNLHVKTDRPSASVLIVSESRSVSARELATDAEGNLELDGLTPANYHRYAFDSLANLEYSKPDALASFTATDISLEPNQTMSVRLPVISTGQEMPNVPIIL